MTEKVWITGAQGLLGQAFVRCFSLDGWVVKATGHEIDISDLNACKQFGEEFRPSIILNPAGFTMVDSAEVEQERAWQANVVGPGNLANIAQDLGAHLVHFSTDYIFDGLKNEPYVETDIPNPLSIYGKSKWAGEQIVADKSRRFWICRVSWLYGLGKSNFLSAMIERMRGNKNLKIAADQVSVPNWTKEISENLLKALRIARDISGTFHFVAKGASSRFDWIKKAADNGLKKGLFKTLPSIEMGCQDDFPALAKRPVYSAMDSTKSEKALGIQWRNWEEVLYDFIEQELR